MEDDPITDDGGATDAALAAASFSAGNGYNEDNFMFPRILIYQMGSI